MNPLFLHAYLSQKTYEISECELDGVSQQISDLTGFTPVKYITDTSSGLQATLFKNGDTFVIAIRGTDEASDTVALAQIAAGVPPSSIAQYQKLKAWVNDLRVDGVLTAGANISVTGHSLGGYLAPALKADQDLFDGSEETRPRIVSAYAFNAPGEAGVIGTIGQSIQNLFGTASAAEGVYNIVSSEGASPISGLGFDPAPPTVIKVAYQNTAIGQHGIAPIADALLVADTFNQVANVGQERLNSILDLFGSPGANELEEAMQALGRALGVANPATGTNSFERLAAYRKEILLAFGSLGAPLQALDLTVEQMVELAKGTGAEAAAARNALYYLSPIAFVSPLQPDITGFSEEFWNQRGLLLKQKHLYNERDLPSVGDYTPEGSYPDVTPPDQIEHVIEDGTTGYQVARGPTYSNTARVLFAGEAGGRLEGGEGIDYLFGNKGNDWLYGHGESDVLFGAGGADNLYGGDGHDLISGGAGQDHLYGGEGDDWLGFAAKSLDSGDIYERSGGANVYEGGTGNDYIYTSSSADTIIFNLGDGRDTVISNGGADVLSIRPTAGRTLPSIGANLSGVDFIPEGLDLMVWLGEINGAASDSIRFINWFDYSRPGIRATSTQFLTQSWTAALMTQIALQSRGTEEADELTGIVGFSRRFDALGGDDVITGATHPSGQTAASGDVYIGGTGNDTITGSNRSDWYVYSLGDGHDTIKETGGSDTLELIDIDLSDVTFVRYATDLTVSINSFEILTIEDWYAGSSRELGWWQFDDIKIQDYVIKDAVRLHFGNEGNDTIGGFGTVYGGGGDDQLSVRGGGTIYGDDGNDTITGSKLKDYLYGGAGDDFIGLVPSGQSEDKGWIYKPWNSLTDESTHIYKGPAAGQGNYYEGGTGNDVIYGTIAGDTYVYNYGDGWDTIRENKPLESSTHPDVPQGEIDTLIVNGVFDWRAKKSGGANNSDLVLEFLSVTDEVVGGIRLPDYFFSYNGKGLIENFEIAGQSLSYSHIENAAGLQEGTSSNNTLRGIAHISNQIFGFGGDDKIYGGSLADALFGGAGNDEIYGGSGENIFEGGAGRDQMFGGADADIYRFYASEGGGVDTVQTGDTLGHDQLHFVDHTALFLSKETEGGLRITGNSSAVSLPGFFNGANTATLVHSGGWLAASAIASMFALQPPEAGPTIQILGA